MSGNDSNIVKRLAIGCAAAILLLVVLIVIAAKLGYFHVVQDLSSGGGEN